VKSSTMALWVKMRRTQREQIKSVFRFGSLASFLARSPDVCLSRDSGEIADIPYRRWGLVQTLASTDRRYSRNRPEWSVATACRRRGSHTANSVKSSTSLSTAIVPPCW
jgi:hypothetical protein